MGLSHLAKPHQRIHVSRQISSCLVPDYALAHEFDKLLVRPLPETSHEPGEVGLQQRKREFQLSAIVRCAVIPGEAVQLAGHAPTQADLSVRERPVRNDVARTEPLRQTIRARIGAPATKMSSPAA
jgi:hypothetical protein